MNKQLFATVLDYMLVTQINVLDTTNEVSDCTDVYTLVSTRDGTFSDVTVMFLHINRKNVQGSTKQIELKTG